jgi:hypothetical protein
MLSCRSSEFGPVMLKCDYVNEIMKEYWAEDWIYDREHIDEPSTNKDDDMQQIWIKWSIPIEMWVMPMHIYWANRSTI